MKLEKLKILIIGHSGGVGKAIKKELSHDFEIQILGRDIWDMQFPEGIESINFSNCDCIVNCVGYNVGAYKGFLGNDIKNQNNQVTVNFTSQLAVMKHFLNNRKGGQLIYFTSENILDPKAYNLFYTAAKKALSFSAKVLSKEYPNFYFTEIRPGKIRSNMLKQNYEGSISDEAINEMYDQADYVMRVNC